MRKSREQIMDLKKTSASAYSLKFAEKG